MPIFADPFRPGVTLDVRKAGLAASDLRQAFRVDPKARTDCGSRPSIDRQSSQKELTDRAIYLAVLSASSRHGWSRT
jgi:hypothetical protein